MSLIQEALEKAGRMPVMAQPLLSPEEKTTRAVLETKEIKIKTKLEVKTEPFWLVGLRVNLLNVLDKLRIKPAVGTESRKTGFLALGVILLFLGTVFYVHTVALKPAGGILLNDGQPQQVLSPEAETSPVKAVSPQISSADFQLTGITYIGDSRLALINDQVVGVGEKLMGQATVLEIQSRRVVLDLQGKKIELLL